MKNIFYRLATLLLLSTAINNAGASAADQLNTLLNAMSSITADFQQRIENEQGDILQESSGELILNRPQQFLWRTLSPYEHLLVANDNVLWLHDLDLEQVTKQSLSEDIQQTPALLLSGDIEQINNQFVITYTTQENQQTFDLTPKHDSGIFTQLSLTFSNKLLSAMSFRDGFSQLTTIEFDNVILNPTISSSTFTFVPPVGIDIINNDSGFQPSNK